MITAAAYTQRTFDSVDLRLDDGGGAPSLECLPLFHKLIHLLTVQYQVSRSLPFIPLCKEVNTCTLSLDTKGISVQWKLATPTLHLFEIIVDALPIILDVACTNTSTRKKILSSIYHAQW